ncbi:MAG: efflux RND transporter permease subunit [Labilibaculum sp.]|nr:efflux RND transporter permease subunit [Labilibaculum sp.]
MNIKTFIDRPLLSGVISLFIVIVGIISLFTLPVEKYPDIAPPTILVSASYPGASAEAIQKSVVAPLEEAINGVENMIYMTSSASNSGTAEITVYFKQGSNADMATVNVQNRVAQANGVLPAEVVQIGVTTAKQQPGILRIVALESPDGTYDEAFLSNYFTNTLKPELLRIQGVGNVQVFGGAYSLRIWLNPEIMAQYKLVPSDIALVLKEQNIEAAVGSLGESSQNVFQYTLRYTGRKSEVSEFENMVIRTFAYGEELRLKDVAEIELGLNEYNFNTNVNGNPGTVAMITQMAGSNAAEINTEIDHLFERIEKNLPKDVKIISMENTNDFLFASIREVVITLLIAIVLVLLVVYFFLQDLRATLIPTIGILVSLVGTFAFMSIAGFSLNLLTLFALVLVIGTVVDNSIVVVEAVQSRFDAGYKSPYRATVDAMSGLTTALFTTTIVFMVIFIPVSFLGGTSGVFYKQFGLTMAAAVGISFISALTLSPALCATLLRPNPEEGKGSKLAGRVRMAYNTAFHAMLKQYTGAAMLFIRKKWLVWSSVALTIIMLVFFMSTTKTGLVPDEDTGSIYVDITAPPGYSMAKTDEIMAEILKCIEDIPAIETIAKVSGFGIISGNGVNMGSLFIQLKNWDERKSDENSVNSVISEIYIRTAQIKSAQIYALAPGMIPGYGSGGGFEFSVQNRNDGDLETFYNITQNYLSKLMECPEIAEAFSSYRINYPQFALDVDASKCKRLGVSPSDVLAELGAYYGGAYVSNFNKFSKVYRVMIQAAPEYRDSEQSLDNVFIRVGNEMAPVSQFVSITKEYSPMVLTRFNMYGNIAVNGNYAPGYSSGNAIKAIQEVAKKELPVGYAVDFSGITREESKGGNNTIFVFVICLLFVYLVMVALYESLFIPFAVILSVPFGLMGSFLFAKLFGIENNIYLQVGLIMLIGLLAKTAILLTEYATQCRHAGMSLKQSAFFAAKIRLRPILMTSFTMIFGMLPLVFASGVGANGSQTIGVGTVGGMLVGTLGLLFIVPALFIIFQTLQEKVKPITFSKPTDPLIIKELELIKEYTELKNKDK